MAKLYFRYSSMGAGKSLDLLKTRFNYLERGKKVLVFTSGKDNRFGINIVKSRIGLESEAIGVGETLNIFDYINELSEKPDCVLVDEVQFFSKIQIYQLSDVVDLLNIPVIAYGLRSDFKLGPFEGSTYMLILSDQIEELKTLCHNCDKKAILNIKYVNGKIESVGRQVDIGGNEKYISLCRKCYKKMLVEDGK
jgi:thymidine kinase